MTMTRKIKKAVLPVAGLGTRFLPATKAVPKEMLTVVDKPVVQYVVEEAMEAGIEHFVFVTGRNKGSLKTISTSRPSLKRRCASAARPLN
jgi:UTP--glucose-1-phosphate uridylyltransferase